MRKLKFFALLLTKLETNLTNKQSFLILKNSTFEISIFAYLVSSFFLISSFNNNLNHSLIKFNLLMWLKTANKWGGVFKYY